jgi:hypothetical protein
MKIKELFRDHVLGAGAACINLQLSGKISFH